MTADSQWPLWEVFTQGSKGEPFEHAGSVHAADAENALQNARDVYARRGEAVNLWVVPSAAIVASAYTPPTSSCWVVPFCHNTVNVSPTPTP